MSWDSRVEWETHCTLVTRIEWQEALETELGGKNNSNRGLEVILYEGVDWIATYIVRIICSDAETSGCVQCEILLFS